jgi:hypothetical protein
MVTGQLRQQYVIGVEATSVLEAELLSFALLFEHSFEQLS